MKNKIKLFKALKTAIIRPETVSGNPVHIQIEPTTYCNLTCPHCVRDKYVVKPAHMSFDNFKKIVDMVSPLNISLNGLGETFLNPEIFKMIKYAKQKGVSVSTISNFVGISDESLGLIASSSLDIINISLDATNSNTYIKVRKSDSFEQILKQVSKLIRMKKAGTPFPSIRLSFVIEKENYSEIKDFYFLAKNLGVDAVLFQVFNSFDENKKEIVSGMDPFLIQSSLEEVMDLELNDKGDGGQEVKTNAEFLLSRIEEIKKVYSDNKVNAVKKCVMPWISTYISVEGDIRYCCIFSGRRINIGNIFAVDSFLEVFNNEQYKEFRKNIKKGIVPNPICAECIPESPLDIVRRSKWTPNYILKKSKIWN